MGVVNSEVHRRVGRTHSLGWERQRQVEVVRYHVGRTPDGVPPEVLVDDSLTYFSGTDDV